MNGSTIPEGSVEWTEVRDGEKRRWAVEERASVYVVHLVAVKTKEVWGSPALPAAAVVFWKDEDEGKAQDWLRQEAAADAKRWQPCLLCGKAAHATKAPYPGYCGKACWSKDSD